MAPPLVTFCIPSYNHAAFIAESIQGVLDQDYPLIELIIIDDGSTDGSEAVIQSYVQACEDRFVRFEFRSRPNKGLAATLNEGLDWARGKYLSVIASDDIATPNRVHDLISHLESNEDLVAVFGQQQVINDSGKLSKSTSLRVGDWSYSDIVSGSIVFPGPAGCIRIDALRGVGGFIQIGIIEDLPTYLNLTKNGRSLVRTIPEVVVRYRIHGHNTTRKIDRMLESRLSIIQAYAEGTVAAEARSRAYATAASQSAFTNTITSLRYLAKAEKIPARRKAKIALAALTPNFLLKLIYENALGRAS